MVDKIQVITGVARRRRYGDEERLRIVAETMESGATLAEVARRHGVGRSLLQNWRRRLRSGTLPGAEAEVVSVSRELPPAPRVAPRQLAQEPFVRVAVQAPPTCGTHHGDAACARIVLSSGVALEIAMGADPIWVAQLVTAIGGRR